MKENYLKESDYYIIKAVKDSLGLKKNTARLWKTIIDEYLVPIDFIKENYSNYKKQDLNELVFKQISMMKDNDIAITDDYKNWLRKNPLGTTLSNFVVNLFMECNKYNNDEDKMILMDIIKRNYFRLDKETISKAIGFLGINNAFICGIADQDSVNDHINEFDFELISKLGKKQLSFDWVEQNMPEDKLDSMENYRPNDRPNISADHMPAYESGGFCIDNKLFNGFELYVPYGLTTDITESLDYSGLVLLREIEDAENLIRELNEKESENSEVTNAIIEMQKQRIEKASKAEFILRCISSTLYNI